MSDLVKIQKDLYDEQIAYLNKEIAKLNKQIEDLKIDNSTWSSSYELLLKENYYLKTHNEDLSNLYVDNLAEAIELLIATYKTMTNDTYVPKRARKLDEECNQ